MFLQSRPEERYWQVDFASGKQDGVLSRARVMEVYDHALWPLQCSSDILLVNRDSNQAAIEQNSRGLLLDQSA
jgi:hypothetical protein